MKPDLNEWNIVVAGQWNPHIFSPQWICKTLLNIEMVESEFAVGPLGAGMRYLTDKLAILPGHDRLIIGMRDTNDATVMEAERITLKTLELLGHTPIRAAGVNFAYIIEEDIPEHVLRAFELTDNNILADAGYSVSATEIVRDLSIEHATLKLKMVHSDQLPTKFHFNFHHVVDSAEQAATLLKDKTIAYRNRALNLLKNSYQLTLEEEGVHANQNGQH